eukprot:jgi/Mesvir1/4841/Mv25254-RA.1
MRSGPSGTRRFSKSLRHEYTKAAMVRRFIFLWNSAMRRAWLWAQEQYKVWDPGPNNDRPSPLELFHALGGSSSWDATGCLLAFLTVTLHASPLGSPGHIMLLSKPFTTYHTTLSG